MNEDLSFPSILNQEDKIISVESILNGEIKVYWSPDQNVSENSLFAFEFFEIDYSPPLGTIWPLPNDILYIPRLIVFYPNITFFSDVPYPEEREERYFSIIEAVQEELNGVFSQILDNREKYDPPDITYIYPSELALPILPKQEDIEGGFFGTNILVILIWGNEGAFGGPYACSPTLPVPEGSTPSSGGHFILTDSFYEFLRPLIVNAYAQFSKLKILVYHDIDPPPQVEDLVQNFELLVAVHSFSLEEPEWTPPHLEGVDTVGTVAEYIGTSVSPSGAIEFSDGVHWFGENEEIHTGTDPIFNPNLEIASWNHVTITNIDYTEQTIIFHGEQLAEMCNDLADYGFEFKGSASFSEHDARVEQILNDIKTHFNLT